MKTRHYGLVCLILVLLGALALAVMGCGGTTETTTTAAAVTTTVGGGTETTVAGETTTTAAATAAPVAVTEWKIPVLSVMSGPVAFAGEPAAWGAQYAVDEINAAGGIRGVPIKIEVIDTAFDPAKAVSAMTSAIADALVILGPMDAPSGEAAAPIAAEAKVPAICAVTNDPIRKTCAPYGIDYMYDDQDGTAVLEWIKANPDIKTVVSFGDPSDPGSYAGNLAAIAALEAIGVKVVKEIEVKSGQLDMATPAVQALAAKADGYMTVLRQEELAKLAIELKNRGMTEGRRIYMTFASIGAGLLDLAKGSLEGAYGYNFIDTTLQDPKYLAMSKAFSAAHEGQPLTIQTVVAYYNMIYAIKAAFEAQQITGDPAKLVEERQKIADTLFNSGDMPGIQGTFKWNNGKMAGNAFLVQIKDNTFATVGTITIK